MNISFTTIKELRELLSNKKLSHKELLKAFLERSAQINPKIDALLELFDESSIVQNAKSGGILDGIPGVLKDNIAQEGRLLTCSSKILENYKASYDSTVATHLKDAGAYIIGRANLDEFAMGSSTETSAFMKTKNPWDVTRVPGGSSGGSAAAVAAGMVPWALGSDTGGSVRQPAGLCGIVGLKPTYGLVSRYGLIAYASSLDQVGVLTRTVHDNALVFSAIAGNDPKDASSASKEKKDYTKDLTGKLRDGLKIGVVQNALHAEGMDPDVVKVIEESLEQFKKLGATLVPITLPALDYSAATYFIISRAEAASNLARFDGVRYGLRTNAESLVDMYSDTRHDGFGEEVKARILVGNYVLSAGHAADFYQNAKKVQRLIRREFLDAFAKVDVLIMPTQPAPAFQMGAFDVDKLQMDLQDYFTCPANLAGIPGISVPCGFSNNMPIGMQIFGPHFSEQLLYHVAYSYEQVTPWHTMHPEL